MEQNRIWIVLNFLCLITIIIFFYIARHFQWPLLMIIIEIALILLFILSFLNAFIKTKFWNLVHSSEKKLDEREILVVLKSLKLSYSIFTIVCLIIIYGFAIAERGPVDVLIAGTLLYLAHTIPAAIVGWNEILIERKS